MKRSSVLRSIVTLLFCTLPLAALSAFAGDLPDVKKAGVLRHIGVPYANFVSGSGDGMDVEIIKLFAKQLGVKYEYVKSDWGTVVEDLVGKKVKAKGDEVEFGESVPVKGDLIANGFTILPWRQKAVDFSVPTFPSQIWLVARADSKMKPIKSAKNLDKDIVTTRALIKGKKVLALPKTCLDPAGNKLDNTGAEVVIFDGNLNELAPALVNNVSELTILDVPDALIGLEKWPGKIKIIGPTSGKQTMGVAFPKESPQLREAFNEFFKKMKKDGVYDRIIKKYYPTAPSFFPEFFKKS
jgi:ABC-type amino acid transport substrate-binding protein